MTELTLIVLRCEDLEISKQFFAGLGLLLFPEKHGGGPLHYAAKLGNTVLELYPAKGKSTTDLRLGLTVENLAVVLPQISLLGGTVKFASQDRAVVTDPDGHTIELSVDPTRSQLPQDFLS